MRREHVVLRPSLGGDDIRDAPDESAVERRRERHRLREHRRLAGARDAVQRLVPPVVRLYPEAFDRRRVHHQLAEPLLRRHLRDELHSARGAFAAPGI